MSDWDGDLEVGRALPQLVVAGRASGQGEDEGERDQPPHGFLMHRGHGVVRQSGVQAPALSQSSVSYWPSANTGQ